MQWLWGKREVVKYVPIPSWGQYSSLWEDKGYLYDATHVGDGKVYQVEVTQLIKDMRDKADNAPTVEALKAYNECIALAKSLLTLSHVARRRLDDIACREELEKAQ